MSKHKENTPSRKPSQGFYIILSVMWLWPLILLLCTFEWGYPSVGLRLLCKSTWVFFAGITQSMCLLWACQKRYVWDDKVFVLAMFLFVVSFFLLPFGMVEWGFHYQYKNGTMDRTYRFTSDWSYLLNLFLSFLLHCLSFVLQSIVYAIANPEESKRYAGGVQTRDYDSNMESDLDAVIGIGAGAMMAKSWMDSPFFKPISDDYYGHHGEFDLNDEARRSSEYMQQFHQAHPKEDLSDHFFWDDIQDAGTDGYLDEE